MKEKRYLSTLELKRKYRVSRTDVIPRCKDGKIADWYTEKSRYYVNEECIAKIIEENDIPVGAYGYIPQGSYTIVDGYDYQYAVNNKSGDVVDFNMRRVLMPQPNKTSDKKGNIYYQVYLMKDGKKRPILQSRLVADTILPNKRGCDNVHHINGKTADNRPTNLLHCFSGKEHGELDKLMNAIKKNPMDKDIKKAYADRIRRIRKLNNEDVYKIPHPDYTNTESITYWMQLNKKGYNEYMTSGKILLDCIRGEIVEIKREGDTV